MNSAEKRALEAIKFALFILQSAKELCEEADCTGDEHMDALTRAQEHVEHARRAFEGDFK